MSCTSAHHSGHLWQVSWKSIKKWRSSLHYKPKMQNLQYSRGDNSAQQIHMQEKSMSCTSAYHTDQLWWVSWRSIKKWGSSSRYKPKSRNILYSRGDNSTQKIWTLVKNMSCISTHHTDHLRWVSWRSVKKWRSSSRYEPQKHYFP